MRGGGERDPGIQLELLFGRQDETLAIGLLPDDIGNAGFGGVRAEIRGGRRWLMMIGIWERVGSMINGNYLYENTVTTASCWVVDLVTGRRRRRTEEGNRYGRPVADIGGQSSVQGVEAPRLEYCGGHVDEGQQHIADLYI